MTEWPYDPRLDLVLQAAALRSAAYAADFATAADMRKIADVFEKLAGDLTLEKAEVLEPRWSDALEAG